jgi:hypothetical protein
MTIETSNFFNIQIEIDGKTTQQLIVTNDTLISNIRNKIGENIELIYDGNILDDNGILGEIGNISNNSIIYGFYMVEPKTHDLIDIFQNILETYTQPNNIPLNHYSNILNSIININSTNNQSVLGNTNYNSNAVNIDSYTTQLDTLINLGFNNNDENLLLLQLYNGDVNQVANLLLEQYS